MDFQSCSRIRTAKCYGSCIEFLRGWVCKSENRRYYGGETSRRIWEGSKMLAEHPKVFISYAQIDEAYERKVLAFANKLRQDGIDADIDLYNPAPKEGWPRWMESRIAWAEFVLIIASKNYWDKYNSKDIGKGVSWEVNVMYNCLYESKTTTIKFIPVYFDSSDVDYILPALKGFSRYNIGDDKGYNDLYRRLIGKPKYQKPELEQIQNYDGKLPPVNPKRQKTTMFFSTPIDLDKWNKAGWRGMVYIMQDYRIPVLGMVFKNYSAARSIFLEWKDRWKDEFADENLAITYILPPFPRDSYAYKEYERKGKGYFVHIGPNVDAATQRAIQSGIKPEELLVFMISRNRWIDECNGSQHRELFFEMAKYYGRYQVMPMSVIDENKKITEENLQIGTDVAMNMRTITVKKGTDLQDNDICKAVLQKQ